MNPGCKDSRGTIRSFSLVVRADHRSYAGPWGVPAVRVFSLLVPGEQQGKTTGDDVSVDVAVSGALPERGPATLE